MVVSYYQTEDNYLDYVKRLTEAEKAVTIAATANFKDAEGKCPKLWRRWKSIFSSLDLRKETVFLLNNFISILFKLMHLFNSSSCLCRATLLLYCSNINVKSLFLQELCLTETSRVSLNGRGSMGIFYLKGL